MEELLWLLLKITLIGAALVIALTVAVAWAAAKQAVWFQSREALREMERLGAPAVLARLDAEIAAIEGRLAAAEQEVDWTDRFLFRMWQNLTHPGALHRELHITRRVRTRVEQAAQVGE